MRLMQSSPYILLEALYVRKGCYFRRGTILRSTEAKGEAGSRIQVSVACPLHDIMPTFAPGVLSPRRGSCLHRASLSPVMGAKPVLY